MDKKGFSLAEMSAVLIVIVVLFMMVVRGRDLIDAVRSRELISTVNKFRMAAVNMSYFKSSSGLSTKDTENYYGVKAADADSNPIAWEINPCVDNGNFFIVAATANELCLTGFMKRRAIYHIENILDDKVRTSGIAKGLGVEFPAGAVDLNVLKNNDFGPNTSAGYFQYAVRLTVNGPKAQ